MTPRQCAAARAALDLNVRELAALAGVGVNTVNRFERGLRDTPAEQRGRIKAALEARGVVFLEDDGSGPGIRFPA